MHLVSWKSSNYVYSPRRLHALFGKVGPIEPTQFKSVSYTRAHHELRDKTRFVFSASRLPPYIHAYIVAKQRKTYLVVKHRVCAVSSTALSTTRYPSPPPHTIANLEAEPSVQRCSRDAAGRPVAGPQPALGGSKSRPAQSACTLPVILCGSITYLTASP